MAHMAGIRWGRAIAGGLLAELVILVLVIPFVFMESGEQILFYAVPPVCLAVTFIFVGGAAGGYVAGRSKPAIERAAAHVS